MDNFGVTNKEECIKDILHIVLNFDFGMNKINVYLNLVLS